MSVGGVPIGAEDMRTDIHPSLAKECDPPHCVPCAHEQHPKNSRLSRGISSSSIQRKLSMMIKSPAITGLSYFSDGCTRRMRIGFAFSTVSSKLNSSA